MRPAVVLFLLVAGVVPAAAHHSFGAVYDANKPITLTGTITRVDWSNPHSHLFIDVKDDKGNVASWTWEGYPPNVLSRTGLKRDVTLRIGDTVTCFGYRARDGSNLAHLREVTARDGKKYFFGPPPGTGEGGPVAQ
jgi:hypothetical protein